MQARVWIAAALWIAALSPCLGAQTRPAKSSQAAPAAENRVDINRATVPELEKVPGITATWAARIVRFRPYRTKLDLLERGVVTSQIYDRIKDSIIAHRPSP